MWVITFRSIKSWTRNFILDVAWIIYVFDSEILNYQQTQSDFAEDNTEFDMGKYSVDNKIFIHYTRLRSEFKCIE